jgi:uncharacterized protein YdhG (YjbR/CyaY superfamily)
MTKKFNTVDDYLSGLSKNTRASLEKFRETIREASPREAEEVIHYNMPALRWNGILVRYAAFKSHIGFYPRASAIIAFKEELRNYRTSKGAIQFPVDRAIPTSLVKRIVRFRVKENQRRVERKS